jgi:hypothetical protein
MNVAGVAQQPQVAVVDQLDQLEASLAEQQLDLTEGLLPPPDPQAMRQQAKAQLHRDMCPQYTALIISVAVAAIGGILWAGRVPTAGKIMVGIGGVGTLLSLSSIGNMVRSRWPLQAPVLPPEAEPL